MTAAHDEASAAATQDSTPVATHIPLHVIMPFVLAEAVIRAYAKKHLERPLILSYVRDLAGEEYTLGSYENRDAWLRDALPNRARATATYGIIENYDASRTLATLGIIEHTQRYNEELGIAEHTHRLYYKELQLPY
jgi:hypothetical protein